VDSETCLSALLQLYYKASTRSGNTGAAATAALNGLLERILGPVTTVEAQGQEVGYYPFVCGLSGRFALTHHLLP
jgi:hypothetical protein